MHFQPYSKFQSHFLQYRKWQSCSFDETHYNQSSQWHVKFDKDKMSLRRFAGFVREVLFRQTTRPSRNWPSMPTIQTMSFPWNSTYLVWAKAESLWRLRCAIVEDAVILLSAYHATINCLKLELVEKELVRSGETFLLIRWFTWTLMSMQAVSVSCEETVQLP